MMYILDSKIKAILTDKGSKVGFSKKPFESLNLGYHVGDNAENVSQNRALILQKYFSQDSKNSLNLDSKNLSNLDSINHKILLYLTQIHSNHIVSIRQNEARLYTPKHTHTRFLESFMPDKTNILRQINLGECDGIICDNSAFVALIMVADCNAILLFSESKTPVFALLHAGRVGVQKKILSNAIEILQNDFNVEARDLKAFISPSIRQCCYEIGSLSIEFPHKYISDNRLNMITMLRDEMKELKILESNINISPICTCCDVRYFSHRREKITGRFGIFASINL